MQGAIDGPADPARPSDLMALLPARIQPAEGPSIRRP
jgi:hypothetical protein